MFLVVRFTSARVKCENSHTFPDTFQKVRNFLSEPVLSA
jgi:hypothetical protein